MTNKTTLQRLKLDPYFSKTIETNLNVWSHDQNSYEIKFEFYDHQCNKPIDLTGADMRILLDHAGSQPKIYPLEIESKVLGLAKFIMPEQIRGCEGKFTAHIYADYPNKTHDFGSFTFYTQPSKIDESMDGCLDTVYVSEFEKALEKFKEIEQKIEQNDLVTHVDLVGYTYKKNDVYTKGETYSNVQIDKMNKLINDDIDKIKLDKVSRTDHEKDLKESYESTKNEIDKTEMKLNNRIDNIISTPTEVSKEEIIDARKNNKSLRDRIDNVELRANEGIVVERKEVVKSTYETIYNDQLFEVKESSLGMKLDELYRGNSVGSKNYVIDVSEIDSVEIPVFKTSGNFGTFFVDSNNVVVHYFVNKDLETGEMIKLKTPLKAKKLVLSISKILDEKDWLIKYNTHLLSLIKNLENSTKRSIEIKKSDAPLYLFEKSSYIIAENSVGKKIDDVIIPGAQESFILKINVSEIESVIYPTYKTTGSFGSVFIDKEDTVIWGHAEKTNETPGKKEVIVPNEAEHLMITISPTLNEYEWSVTLYNRISRNVINRIEDDIRKLSNEKNNQLDDNNNFTLCALHTINNKLKMPFHKGYLFHKMNDDKSLWYGKDYDNINYLTEVEFNPKDCNFAISPKDGRIIAVPRGVRSEFYVWHKEKTFTLFNEKPENGPKGWVYNAGVEFVTDNNGVEHCLFAEYGGRVSEQEGGFHVWKGTYPYTKEENWKKVFFQDFSSSIGVDHFHQVALDPYTNILYLTSGDKHQSCKWWYSKDFGENWTLFAGKDTGFEEHVLRTLNFVFTKDYVYWAVDHGTNHSLNRIKRNDGTGILDTSTREKVVDLPDGQATNSICYVEYPRGIFMFDRIDYGFEEHYNDGIKVQFWSLEKNELQTIAKLDFVTPGWGGHRGKCYTYYTNGIEHRPAMGFSDDTRNQFDLISENYRDIGTIFYEIEGKVKYLK